MSDQLVSLPSNVLAANQRYDACNLLATATRFSLGTNGQNAGNQLERDLDVRFSGLQTIGFADALAWFSQAGVKLTPLDDQVAALLTNGDAETLHQALQTGNVAQSLQLLAVNDGSKLIELDDEGEMQLTPRALSKQAEPCLLLRLGYNVENNYAYYAASLPACSRRPIKLTWDSVVAAGVTAAVAILPPPKPVDLERVTNSMHIMQQALAAADAAHATAHAAHADILDALGQPAVPAMQPAPAQAV